MAGGGSSELLELRQMLADVIKEMEDRISELEKLMSKLPVLEVYKPEVKPVKKRKTKRKPSKAG